MWAHPSERRCPAVPLLSLLAASLLLVLAFSVATPAHATTIQEECPPQGCATAPTGSADVPTAGPGAIAAGTVRLPRTGQITSYAPGDDGAVLAGVAWPNPRFANPNGTTPITGPAVVDQLTGLMWTRDGSSPTTGPCSGGTLSWQGALDYVACLNTNSYLGYTDWRLPNAVEFESLLSDRDYSWLLGQGFTGSSWGGWSSTSVVEEPQRAWSIQQYGLHPFNTAIMTSWARPVRTAAAAPPAALWRTGQTASIVPGDDGAIKAGAAWPGPRLKDNGNGTVTDDLTGLVWLKDANCMATSYPGFDNDTGPGVYGAAGDGAVTWLHALDFVAGINAGTYSDCGGGYGDWRLPNRKELLSLIDFSQFNPALPSGHPFINVRHSAAPAAAFYWSSTTTGAPLGSDTAYRLFLYNGTESFSVKYWDHFVWPVRSPSDGPSPPSLPIEVGDTWSYFKGTQAPPSGWNQIGFNDSGWLAGLTGIGYGDGDDTTVLSDMKANYWSVYARRAFTVPDPAAVGQLVLSVDHDDGFVAYLNGTEVLRRKLGTPGTIPAYNTAAENHDAGSPEQQEISPALLVPGTNVLAIQVHNTTLDSSDLSLIPTLRTGHSALPVAAGDVWRFIKGTQAPPNGWTTTGFNDTGWLSGATPIGYGDNYPSLRTTLPDMYNGYLTVFSRRTFHVPDPGAVNNLVLCMDYDDGFVAYLNGTEVLRRNLPATVTYQTAALSAHEAGTGEQQSINPGLLVQGTNVLAVRIHNRSLTSSDLFLLPTLGTEACPVTGPPPLPIEVGDTWRYFKGTQAPPTDWKQITFDDLDWSAGPTGIGYDDDNILVLGTLLTDMKGTYWSVYARKAFSVPNPAAVGRLVLSVDYDDGFVAYLNGNEVMRRKLGTAGTPPAYNTAAQNHEAGSPEQQEISPALLVPGTNVLAIQVHNTTLASSDLALIPTLRAEPPAGLRRGPCLQNVSQTSVVVMWQTPLATLSKLRYRLPGSPSWTEVSSAAAVTTHELAVGTLTPGTRYEYQVSADGLGAWTPATPARLATAPGAGGSFRAVVYGDTRSNSNGHEAVVQAIVKNTPDIVLHTGDLVANGKTEAEWEPQFFTPARDLMKDTPLWPVVGNHEYYPAPPDIGHMWYYDYFSLPNNEQWYAFSYGCARFIALNTFHGVHDEVADVFQDGTPQHEWLEAEFQSAAYQNADWQFVFFHNPPYTKSVDANGQVIHGDDEEVKEHLVPLFRQYGVDMVFSGHNHHYERNYKDGVNYIVAGAGGAPMYACPAPYPDYMQVCAKTQHHTTIDVSCGNSGTVKFQAWDNSGAPFDTYWPLRRAVVIGQGAALALTSDTAVQGDWTNDGLFIHNLYQITFNGTEEQAIGGSSPTVFYDLSIESGTTVDIPAQNTPAVEGAIENSGTLKQTRDVGAGAPVEFLAIGDKYQGLQITADAGNSLGSTTVQVSDGQTCSSGEELGKAPIERCFEISPTATVSNSATVRLYYLAGDEGSGELNGNDPGTLNIYRRKNGAWVMEQGEYTRETDGGAYDWVQVTGVDGYSHFTVGNHVAIDLASFTATAQSGDVSLAWETTAERYGRGFALWRGSSAEGPYDRITSALIPAQGEPTVGAQYAYTDTAVGAGSIYYYKLEDVDVYELSTMHGPVQATVQGVSVYLPLVLK